MSTIVPVEALARRDERFACTPLRASMTAEACLLRRARVTESGAQVFPFCARCELGAKVEARVGAATRTAVDAGQVAFARAKASKRTRSNDARKARAAYSRQRAEIAAEKAAWEALSQAERDRISKARADRYEEMFELAQEGEEDEDEQDEQDEEDEA